MSRPIHRPLTLPERHDFCRLCESVEETNPSFVIMKESGWSMMAWVSLVSSLIIAVHPDLFRFVLGIVALQVVFVASHVYSHALFLEYDQHHPGTKRLPRSPIYYYAFYHHHDHGHWYPQLGFNGQGFLFFHSSARNIIASHWHGYTLLLNWKTVLLLATYGLINPSCLSYFAGYELGVLLLPLAHGWQHAPQSFGWLTPVFRLLEATGIIANRQSHRFHHDHHSPWVYADFSSSGLSLGLPIDSWLNRWWNRMFDRAVETDRRLADLIRPYFVRVVVTAVVLVPILL